MKLPVALLALTAVMASAADGGDYTLDSTDRCAFLLVGDDRQQRHERRLGLHRNGRV